MAQKFNVIIEKGEDGYLLSEVVELPGCHTQGKTMDQLLERTKEAIALYLKVKKEERPTTKFLGFQQIEIEA
jgi:predicted RNase H-like HicB family nuclease